MFFRIWIRKFRASLLMESLFLAFFKNIFLILEFAAVFEAEVSQLWISKKCEQVSIFTAVIVVFEVFFMVYILYVKFFQDFIKIYLKQWILWTLKSDDAIGNFYHSCSCQDKFICLLTYTKTGFLIAVLNQSIQKSSNFVKFINALNKNRML